MGAVTADEMRAIEQAAFDRGETPAGLVAIAGKKLGAVILRHFPQPGTAIGYIGKGHNGCDALVALEVLREAGWAISGRLAYPAKEGSPLTRRLIDGLGEFEILESVPEFLKTSRPLILIDGLLGIGSKGSLRPELAQLTKEMARLRQGAGARVVSVDIPSGMDPDTGAIAPGGVTADLTIMIAAAKRGALLGDASRATGALALAPLKELPMPEEGGMDLISPWTLDAFHQPREFDFHKGQAGRVGILAGSKCFPGAAVLAATGALRGGAGLVTLHAPAEALHLIASKCPPEVMVRSLEHPDELLDFHYDAWVVGPGLGESDPSFVAALRRILEKGSVPAVIDADALNGLAGWGGLGELPSCHVLTPHPGEFRRLAPDLGKLPSREAMARQFADRHAPVLLLKGARTLVTAQGEPLWCNPTGTPGMASGGQGDALSGVIGALLAQGMPSLQAASVGAWLCGRASERALATRSFSEESLLPSDTLAHLGGAFLDWREGTR